MTSRDREYLLLPAERDLRLDFFRGIGQWMVFLDHIPFDVVNWLNRKHGRKASRPRLRGIDLERLCGQGRSPYRRTGRDFFALDLAGYSEPDGGGVRLWDRAMRSLHRSRQRLGPPFVRRAPRGIAGRASVTTRARSQTTQREVR